MRVLVTGATGFIGGTLCTALAESGHVIRAALRTDRPVAACITEKVVVGDIATTAVTGWEEALTGVEAVVHAAARTHILRDSPDVAHLYMGANAEGTRRLAEAAARAGARRFVYLSSIKVNGEETSGQPYAPSDAPNPRDPYGVSKLLGEKSVVEVAAKSGLEVAIVRPPLVYGPGVRANFLRLLRWVDRGWPLPLGSVHNSRSLVNVWNLCDLLTRVLQVPIASPSIWLVSDAEDLSTADLLRRLGAAMGRRVTLLPFPVSMMQSLAALVGMKAEIARLCESLRVDISQTRNSLAWSPPVSVDEALRRTVEWYLSQGSARAS